MTLDTDDYQALRERIKTALWDAGHLRSWSYNSEVLADAVLDTLGLEQEADMLRRAAEACRSATSQMEGRTDWFSWVPQHLERVANRLGGGS